MGSSKQLSRWLFSEDKSFPILTQAKCWIWLTCTGDQNTKKLDQTQFIEVPMSFWMRCWVTSCIIQVIGDQGCLSSQILIDSLPLLDSQYKHYLSNVGGILPSRASQWVSKLLRHCPLKGYCFGKITNQIRLPTPLPPTKVAFVVAHRLPDHRYNIGGGERVGWEPYGKSLRKGNQKSVWTKCLN